MVANITITFDNDIVLDYCVVANSNITLNDNLILEPDITTYISTAGYMNEILALLYTLALPDTPA